jgi:methanethiol S-methyltransferase
MIAWLNIGALVTLTVLTVILYMLSVRPEAWSRRIGPRAYPLSGRLRNAAMACMFLGLGTFILYYFFPLPIPLPRQLPWGYWISVLTSLLLAVPAGYFLVRGVTDSGDEAAIPNPKTRLFGGVYRRIRHPQAWEGLAWPITGLLLHSPFLVLYGLMWVVLECGMIYSEEKDLVLRFGKEYEEYRKNTPAFFPRFKQ